MSLTQFLDEYGTEEQCEDDLEQLRWPDGFQCPTCRTQKYRFYRRGRTKRVKVFQCCQCRTQTTLTEETIFHSTKLPLFKWFQAMYFLSQNKSNISMLELKRLVGVSYPPAWSMKHKLTQVMYERESAIMPLTSSNTPIVTWANFDIVSTAALIFPVSSPGGLTRRYKQGAGRNTGSGRRKISSNQVPLNFKFKT